MTKDDHDSELAGWRADWQAEPADRGDEASLAALERGLRARIRGMRLVAACEVLVSAGFLAFLGWFAWTSGSWLDVVVMAGLSLVNLGALAFSWWNRRGLWRAATGSTRELFAHLEKRLARRRRGLVAAWVLLGLQVALFVPWIALHLEARGSGQPSPAAALRAWGFLAFWALLAAAVLGWLGVLARREATRLAELGRQLAEHDD